MPAAVTRASSSPARSIVGCALQVLWSSAETGRHFSLVAVGAMEGQPSRATASLEEIPPCLPVQAGGEAAGKICCEGDLTEDLRDGEGPAQGRGACADSCAEVSEPGEHLLHC